MVHLLQSVEFIRCLVIEQSRRDDLEGLANVMIYLTKGTLPW